ncbi:4'-phosphopantetheinyl transferase family protein [Streptomyces monticola]|uniref:4'-phosphopantetheinyl transferase family protein n=1 Tax=Streptomyces monticola TaxID=2666263 RepID=A0ABW2JAB9_9ACTN
MTLPRDPLPHDPLPNDPGARRIAPPPGQDPDAWPQLWICGATDVAAADLALLDADERARADRLRRARDRRLYTTAHVLLRRLIGRHLDRDPAALRYVREPCPGCGAAHGRPALPGAPVHFSLSHSGDHALIALAQRPVGVDLEVLADDTLVDDVMSTLHPQEHAELQELGPGPGRGAAFTRCWTRKEACLKGTGEGLTENAIRTTLVGTGPSPLPVPGWTLLDVPVPGGYAAACAVRARPQD